MIKYIYINRIKLLVTILVLVLVLISSSCGMPDKNAAEPVTKTEFALDTLCSITLYDNPDESLFRECFEKIKDIEQKMSVDLDQSEVSAINKNAGIGPVKVSDETFHVISAGKDFSRMMSGRFDITVGPLVRLWGINKPDHKIPSKDEAKAAASLVDYRNIELNDSDKSVFLKEKGMSLDLGGIAKGYAGDAVAGILKAKGVRHAIVDLGGNLIVIGSKTDGSDWNVGIQTPFKPNGSYFAILNVSDKSVVTSGIYQRYFKENGKIYHHIMDTKTGYPVDNGLISVTVICGSSMDADALAKVFTMGLDEGIRYIEDRQDAEAIFVTDKKEVYTTSGLKGLLKITDEAYQLKEVPKS
jgi:Membrane-associated lipoprotein involved in thiamine biosynthesis